METRQSRFSEVPTSVQLLQVRIIRAYAVVHSSHDSRLETHGNTLDVATPSCHEAQKLKPNVSPNHVDETVDEASKEASKGAFSIVDLDGGEMSCNNLCQAAWEVVETRLTRWFKKVSLKGLSGI